MRQIRRSTCTGEAAEVVGEIISMAKEVQKNVEQLSSCPVK